MEHSVRIRRGLAFCFMLWGINRGNSEVSEALDDCEYQDVRWHAPWGAGRWLKWACERREELMSSGGRGAVLFAARVETPVVEHSCRKDSQRDTGRRQKRERFIRAHPCTVPTREGKDANPGRERQDVWRVLPPPLC